VFDAPGMLTEPFEARMAAIKRWFDKKGDEGAPYARMVVHTKCKGEDHLVAELARIEKRGGEGVMLRQPGSRYVGARYLPHACPYIHARLVPQTQHTQHPTDRARCSR
jgi:DNA ligase-1